jgi:hypothetical protein
MLQKSLGRSNFFDSVLFRQRQKTFEFKELDECDFCGKIILPVVHLDSKKKN